MMILPLFRYELRSCLFPTFIIAAVVILYAGVIISMYDPALGESLALMRDAMPELFAAFGMESYADTLFFQEMEQRTGIKTEFRLENAETLSIFTRQPEQEQPEATISFYVAECMEFPVMGEYHNNLTLEEAIKIYESIPAERLHGIKGIGFDLQDGDEDYSGEYGLMSGDRIDRDLIDMIPHYKESPLVQKAINDMEKYLNEKHGKVQEAEQTVEVKQEVPETPVKKESVSVEPNQTQKKEPIKGEKGELKKSVLQSLKEFQARAKAQEQKNKEAEKPKAHKKGDVEL